MKLLSTAVPIVLSLLLILSISCLTVSANDRDTTALVNGLASFILPGAGQLLNDQPDKALQHFIVIVGIDAVSVFLAPVLYRSPYSLYSIGLAAHLGWSAFSAYDAYSVAKHQGGGIFDSSLNNFNNTEGLGPNLLKTANAVNHSTLSLEGNEWQSELSLSPID